MGLVLAFQTAPRRASSARPAAKRSAEPAKSADILFFTGVRYERYGDSPSGQPDGRRSDASPTGS